MPSSPSSTTNCQVVCLGNPLLDLLADCDAAFLQKYSLKPGDAVLADPTTHKDLYDEMEKSLKVQYVAGGAGLNALRVCQALLSKSADTAASTGGQCVYFGSIGQDERAEKMQKMSQQEGWTAEFYTSTKNPTGTCAVLISDNERSLCANLGAANDYDASHFTSKGLEYVKHATLCYSAGFFLTVAPPAAMEMAKCCLDQNIPYCLNLSAPFLVEFFKDPMMELMPYVDILFGNESEALAFGKVHGLGDNVEEIAKKIVETMEKKNKRLPRLVVFTQGKDETIIATAWCDAGVKVLKYPVQALSAKELVDTNGAGDAFVGGFLAAKTQQKSIDECVAWGHYASRHVIQRSGCTFDFAKAPKFGQ